MRALITAGGMALALMMTAAPTVAQEMPLGQGDYWEVTDVMLEEGQGLAYAQHLATKWKAEQEFAKSKGWIKSYHILSNVHRRENEPDLYLVVVFTDMPTAAQDEQRDTEYLAWARASLTQLQAESAGRASMRRIGGTMLLRAAIIK